ncbi:YdcF family protein [Bacillus sp. DJP31]|uniref:YdcF family protein n=1 Tax=Bacillus sp. DJP31 TaxID=3409789 RepID=UPI003BB66ED5
MKIKPSFKKRFYLVSSVFLVIACFYIAIVHHLISQTANQLPPDEADYLIVLGAKLNGEDMSLALQYRVEVALIYLERNPQTKVIVSGGQGPGEVITEAEAMARYFLTEGIRKDRIIKEDKSTTTYENLLFSKKYIKGGGPLVIVSNDFHLFRASLIADRVGYEKVHTLAAKTPLIVLPKLWVREYAAVLKTWVFDR